MSGIANIQDFITEGLKEIDYPKYEHGYKSFRKYITDNDYNLKISMFRELELMARKNHSKRFIDHTKQLFLATDMQICISQEFTANTSYADISLASNIMCVEHISLEHISLEHISLVHTPRHIKEYNHQLQSSSGFINIDTTSLIQKTMHKIVDNLYSVLYFIFSLLQDYYIISHNNCQIINNIHIPERFIDHSTVIKLDSSRGLNIQFISNNTTTVLTVSFALFNMNLLPTIKDFMKLMTLTVEGLLYLLTYSIQSPTRYTFIQYHNYNKIIQSLLTKYSIKLHQTKYAIVSLHSSTIFSVRVNQVNKPSYSAIKHYKIFISNKVDEYTPYLEVYTSNLQHKIADAKLVKQILAKYSI